MAFISRDVDLRMVMMGDLMMLTSMAKLRGSGRVGSGRNEKCRDGERRTPRHTYLLSTT
jgi:hypothetical protein